MYEGSEFWATPIEDTEILKIAQAEVNDWLKKADSSITKLRGKYVSFGDTGLLTKFEDLKRKSGYHAQSTLNLWKNQ